MSETLKDKTDFRKVAYLFVCQNIYQYFAQRLGLIVCYWLLGLSKDKVMCSNITCKETFVLSLAFDDAKEDTSDVSLTILSKSGMSLTKEPLKVYLRIRPFLDKEVLQKENQGEP